MGNGFSPDRDRRGGELNREPAVASAAFAPTTISHFGNLAAGRRLTTLLHPRTQEPSRKPGGGPRPETP